MIVAPGIRTVHYTKGGEVNCSILVGTDGLYLVDSGPEQDAAAILSEINAMGYDARAIKALLLSHGHASHVAGAARITELSGCTVYASESEIPIVEGRQKAAKVGWRKPDPWSFRVAFLQAGLNAGFGGHTPVAVSERLTEGMRIGPLTAIALPGHTPGHFGFLDAERGVAWAADGISSWPGKPSPGWKSFAHDLPESLRSVAKLAETQPRVVIVGHGEPIREGAVDVLREIANGK